MILQWQGVGVRGADRADRLEEHAPRHREPPHEMVSTPLDIRAQGKKAVFWSVAREAAFVESRRAPGPGSSRRRCAWDPAPAPGNCRSPRAHPVVDDLTAHLTPVQLAERQGLLRWRGRNGAWQAGSFMRRDGANLRIQLWTTRECRDSAPLPRPQNGVSFWTNPKMKVWARSATFATRGRSSRSKAVEVLHGGLCWAWAGVRGSPHNQDQGTARSDESMRAAAATTMMASPGWKRRPCAGEYRVVQGPVMTSPNCSDAS